MADMNRYADGIAKRLDTLSMQVANGSQYADYLSRMDLARILQQMAEDIRFAAKELVVNDPYRESK